MSNKSSDGLMQFDLGGRRIIVTGGGYGLGKAMALGLAAAGAQVAIAGRTENKLIETVNQIEHNGGSAMYCLLDATNRSSCEDMIKSVVDQWGGIDSIVINHGVIEKVSAGDTSEQQWSRVIDTNLSGCFYCAQAAGKQLIAQGSGGSVVLISSNGSMVAFDGLTAYGASKGGVDMMCKQLTMEWGQYGIRVNTVNPGYTTNPMGGKYEAKRNEELEAEIRKLTPLQRRGDPEDFVGPVIFLCSDASRFVSGHSLVVDGGYCAV